MSEQVARKLLPTYSEVVNTGLFDDSVYLRMIRLNDCGRHT